MLFDYLLLFAEICFKFCIWFLGFTMTLDVVSDYGVKNKALRLFVSVFSWAALAFIFIRYLVLSVIDNLSD